jgi:hypothetical protein
MQDERPLTGGLEITAAVVACLATLGVVGYLVFNLYKCLCKNDTTDASIDDKRTGLLHDSDDGFSEASSSPSSGEVELRNRERALTSPGLPPDGVQQFTSTVSGEELDARRLRRPSAERSPKGGMMLPPPTSLPSVFALGGEESRQTKRKSTHSPLPSVVKDEMRRNTAVQERRARHADRMFGRGRAGETRQAASLGGRSSSGR